MPNRTPDKQKIELDVLVKQIAKARALLNQVRQKINVARQEARAVDGRKLVEVNERLIVAAMENQSATDSAMQALDALARSAQIDPLTQLPNRTMMDDRITQAISTAKRHGRGLALFFIDVNEFKSINDKLGHSAGDRVLTQIAARLQDAVRNVDTVSRHGGDEFLVLLPEIEKMANAKLVAEKLHEAVSATMTVSGKTLCIRLSIGIAIFPTHGTESAAMIAYADRSMYRSKKASKTAK